MILAAAQTKPHPSDIGTNLNEHYKMIELASKNGAKLILFPEMSITDYQREMAKEMAFVKDDKRLIHLRGLSVKHQIVVIAGAPVLLEGKLYIGAFIIQPDNTVNIYTKQFLHTGEEVYFESSFDFNPLISIKNEKLSVAICADINHSEHAESAKQAGTTIYLTGIFFETQDMPKAYKNLSGYATRFSMNILMANYAGQSWGLQSGGKSAFWDTDGSLIANLDEKESGLLIVKKVTSGWTGKAINTK